MGKPTAPPVIADSDAMKTARSAAAAVGLTVEELADLMVDNALTALPPKDGVTQRYTLEDLGARLWGDLQQELPSKRAEWFDWLSDPQKTAIIVKMRSTGFSTLAVANDFQVSERKIRDTYNAYSDQLGAQVSGIRLDTLVGQMQMVHERVIELAAREGDYSAMWRFQKELLAALQSVGIVERAIHRVEVSHGLTDAAKEEIDLLADLERKKLLRIEAVAQHEKDLEQGDKLPDELATEDEE